MLPVFLVRPFKITALLCNCLLAFISIVSLFIAVFSWFTPPSAGISPNPISDHHQYSIAVFFVGITSISIFLLALLGILALLLCSSFCMFLFILVLLVQISIQIVLSVFAIANRNKIHATIISQWRTRSQENPSDGCSDAACSDHLQSLNQAEQIIFIALLIFLSTQVLLLFISCCYCDYLSEREQYETIEKDNANSN